MTAHDTNDKKDIYDTFKDAVNMSASELETWLKTDEAKSVGIGKDGGKKTDSSGGKSVGYKSGEYIVKILHKNKGDLTDDDYDQMKRVTSYVHRHLAQKPTKEDPADSRWRYSLKNWGHDPLK